MSEAKLFLVPMFVHILMTLVIGVLLLNARVESLRQGRAKIDAAAIDPWAWPRRVRVLGHNFSNQFETPMLWYAVGAMVLATSLADMVMVVLSWGYLATRVVHHFVQVGENRLSLRTAVFAAGFAILVGMWLWFGVKFFLFA